MTAEALAAPRGCALPRPAPVRAAAQPPAAGARVLIRPYRPDDLDTLILQPAQAHAQAQLLGHGYAQALAQCEAWTFVLEEPGATVPQGDLLRGAPQGDLLRGVPQGDLLRGVPQGDLLRGARILACIGLIPFHPKRALAWALIAGDCGAHFQAIHRTVRRYLRITPYARIEAHVEAGFANGARWMRLLGFADETPQGMRAYTPEGRTCHLYAWLAPGAATQTPI